MNVRAASVRLAVIAWLLLTNLSLGQHHRHEEAVGVHQAAPEAWHCHVLVLGVELDFLSLNSETCPFKPTTDGDHESHALLSSLLDPGTEQESSLTIAPDASLFCMLQTPCPGRASVAPGCPLALAAQTGWPPSAAVLGARSGVQQI